MPPEYLNGGTACVVYLRMDESRSTAGHNELVSFRLTARLLLPSGEWRQRGSH